MKINITLKTVENLGDHGREYEKVIDVSEYTTIKELVDKHLFNKFTDKLNYSDSLIIRAGESDE